MTHPPISETRHAIVRGRVQGVGFREACVRQAQALGVTGWVRNRWDGSVEVMLQGRPEALDRMAVWLQRGPLGARVDAVEIQPVAEAPRFDSFERRATG